MLFTSEYYNELKCFSVELIKSLGTFQLLFADVRKTEDTLYIRNPILVHLDIKDNGRNQHIMGIMIHFFVAETESTAQLVSCNCTKSKRNRNT